MGLKFSRKRDVAAAAAAAAAANGAEAAEEAAAPEGGEGQPGTPQAVDKGDLDVVVGKPASPVATVPSQDCVWECKEATEGEEAESEDTPAPDDPAGAQAVPPEPTATPADLPADPQPASEAQSHKDAVTIETTPGPVASSPSLVNGGDPAPGPEAAPASPPGDEARGEAAEEEVGEPMEAEPEGSSQEVRDDADEASVDKLLENLELTGSDLTTDVIPTETCGDAST